MWETLAPGALHSAMPAALWAVPQQHAACSHLPGAGRSYCGSSATRSLLQRHSHSQLRSSSAAGPGMMGWQLESK